MPQICSVCCHEQRLQIERALVAGTSLRIIAERYGPSKTAVSRHRSHAKAAIARSTQAREELRAGRLLDDVRAGEQRAQKLFEKAHEILLAAVENNDRDGALRAIRTAAAVMAEGRAFLTVRGELCGELGRDRAVPAMSVQIVCPTAPSADGLPQISYRASDAIEGSFDEAEIGLRQLR